ncbi:GNAT family N-acetyltransferase [Thalassomonas haliotis]|uniref:GNAT family N-acetyltransferase n=1 Tax=Thalassomonas haliotis TaxID=485448 RepID=A0ABY7VLE1_9GAMM|nr:GNAT family N-acetyltransferase [Thalassomonas haliotis]WDE13763.1 GNAT family N-acetyltransferase [Thalassomonas haliotis]
MAEINCRILTAKDSLDYRRVRLESLKFHPECYGSDHERELKIPKLYFEQLIANASPKGLMLGAFHKSELVGLCGLIASSPGAVEVIQMYVAADHRRAGVGLKLLSLAKQCPGGLSARFLHLSVFEDNASALKTYQRAGFNLSHRENGQLYMTFKL